MWQDRRMLSGEWVRMAMEREYELHPFGETGMTGKGGMYGQAAVFSQSTRCALAWHAHEESERMKELTAYLESMAI